MKILKADHQRRVEIPGVPDPVQRPVDIDKSQTDFKKLRSLRIYRFDAGAAIDGHAEEDEVFVIVLAGFIEFVAISAPPAVEPTTQQLSAPNDLQPVHCAAYLPPHAAYHLTAKTNSIVAYARATPASGNPPAAFQASVRKNGADISTLLEERTYAQQLRLRLLHIDSSRGPVAFAPINKLEPDEEALVHLQLSTEGISAAATISGNDSLPLESWDTVAISSAEHPALHLTQGCSALLLVVSAI